MGRYHLQQFIVAQALSRNVLLVGGFFCPHNLFCTQAGLAKQIFNSAAESGCSM